MTPRAQCRTLRWFSFLCAAGFILACWIVPYRLYFGPGHSYWTFGYIGDEYFYAERIGPLLPGTNSLNPVNGICDSACASPYVLEDACRAFNTIFGIQAPTFFWIVRVTLPVLLLIVAYVLSSVCVSQRVLMRSSSVRWVLSLGALAMIYFQYPFQTKYPPLYGWLNRVPTGVEYPLSILTAASFIYFASGASPYRGAMLAVVLDALVYLRPYIALPWWIAVALGCLFLALKRKLGLKTFVVSFAVLVAGLIPFVWTGLHNGSQPAYQQMTARYFVLPGTGVHPPYQIHPQWMLYLAMSIGIALCALLNRRNAVFSLSVAVSLAMCPFIFGLLTVSSQLLSYDRLASFYQVGISACCLQLANCAFESWHGSRALVAVLRFSASVLCFVAIETGVIAYQYSHVDFDNYVGGSLKSIVEDQSLHPVYEWIRANTPPDALFLVDDGYDWSTAPQNPAEWTTLNNELMRFEDLFRLLACRRRVYSKLMFVNMMLDHDIEALELLQRGTFGLGVPKDDYVAALKRFRPTHVLWRKRSLYPQSGELLRIPRGYGKVLQSLSKNIHEDDEAIVWEIHYQ